MAKAKLIIERKQRLMKNGLVRLHLQQKKSNKKGVIDPKPIDLPYKDADKFEVGEEFDKSKLAPKKEESESEKDED